MSITFRILGTARTDNSLLVQIDSGQSIEKVLFDCGDHCLADVSFAEIQSIDHLFFSHLHMDHIGGFDSFFRCTFNRSNKRNQIWGPPETARILQHRFQGFLWNLHEEMSATWFVSDIHPSEIQTTRFELREAFGTAHEEDRHTWKRIVCDRESFAVEAITMDHRTPTLAYIVREKSRRNIDTSRLANLGLRPGPWLKQLKDPSFAASEVMINGVAHSADGLRKQLMVETVGDSIAYLTDFLLDDSAMERLSNALRGCQTMVCEGQYRHADLELARGNCHMTTVQAATLAKRAQVEKLVLFHLSDRYEDKQRIEMLEEAREIFPNTHYPPHWNMET
jgi:ribonuclease Z